MKHTMFIIAFWLLAMSPAQAFDFSRVAESRAVEREISPIRYWDAVPAERGDTVSHYCQAFLRERPIAGVGIYDCVDLVSPLNGITNRDQYRTIQIGQLIWLPSPRNTAADMVGRHSMRFALAETTGDAQALANNPLGMARSLLQALEQLKATDARLAALETRHVKAVDVPALLEQALRDSEVLRGMRAADTEAMKAYVDAQLANRSTTADLTEAAVNRLIAAALADAGLPQSAIDTIETAVDNALSEYNQRLTAVETQLADTRAELTAKADQSVVSDLSNQVANLASDIDGRFDAVNNQLDQLPRATSSWVNRNFWWVLAAFALVILALMLSGLLWWRKTQRGEVHEVQSQVRHEQTGLTATYEKATSAETKADEAHVLAGRALQEARVATNLGLPDGWVLIGDMPTQADIDTLNDGEKLTLRFKHETKDDRQAVFTMAKKSLPGPDGNMVDGLTVSGIAGLVKPIAAKPLNMIGKVRNGINSNKFVGVDKDSNTAGPKSTAA